MFPWSFSVLSNVKSNRSYFNNSLLFQFILAEFLLTYREALSMSELVKNLKKKPLPIFGSNECEESLNKIKSTLKILGGNSQDQQCLFSWGYDNSFLGKLKNTCALFASNFGKEDKNAASLHRYSHRAWSICSQSVDLLQTMKKGNIDNWNDSFVLLLNLIEKMQKALQHFSKLITRFLHDFKQDENVLFFVLRHQEQLDTLFGSHFVIQLFTEMFSNVKEAGKYISKKYEYRGFNQILPLITKKISEFQVVQA